MAITDCFITKFEKRQFSNAITIYLSKTETEQKLNFLKLSGKIVLSWHTQFQRAIIFQCSIFSHALFLVQFWSSGGSTSTRKFHFSSCKGIFELFNTALVCISLQFSILMKKIERKHSENYNIKLNSEYQFLVEMPSIYLDKKNCLIQSAYSKQSLKGPSLLQTTQQSLTNYSEIGPYYY